MRVAAVDIGTNTVRLLVADVTDGRLRELDRRSRIAGLGRGVDRSGRLGEEGISRALVAVCGYGALGRHYAVDAIRAVATSAVRDAGNADSFLDRAGLALGTRPEVISGGEEAALSFRGAISGTSGSGPFLVIDPGGGSTEFVFGITEPAYAISVDIGSVRVTDRCLAQRPAPPADVAAAHAEAARVMAAVVMPGPAAAVLAVASTPMALAALALGLDEFDRDAVTGVELTVRHIDDLIERLAGLSIAETAALPSLEPARAPVILGGAIVVREALRTAGAEALVVSGADILDGIALGLA